eukprot:3784042-Ditylum_brightwellii.AAC.1
MLQNEDAPDEIKKKISRNRKKKIHEKYGVKIPMNALEVLLMDKANKDTKWANAIKKEMDAWKDLGSLCITMQRESLQGKKVGNMPLCK